MTTIHLQILSTLLGFAGTLIMFFFSHSLKPLPGGIFGSEAINRKIDEVKKENKKFAFLQKVGLGMLVLSFLCQFITYFF